jgi:hypothetical protein
VRELTVTAIAILFVTTLGIAVFALDDQQTVAAAPEAVAEGLVNQLVADRPDQTLQYLSSYARDEFAAPVLAQWIATVERTTGSISKVQTSKASIGENLAETTLTLRGPKATVQAQVNLVREAGLWKVEALALP